MFRVLEELKQPAISKNELNQSYDCDMCESGDWLSETEVEIHKRSMHRKELLKRAYEDNVCMLCGLKLASNEALLRHVRTAHFYSSAAARRVERELFVCAHCHDVFFNKQMLATHIVHKHRNKVVLTCPKCPKRLLPHLAYGHLSTRHQFQSVSLCPVCLTKRANRAELARHMASHNKYYHCGMCGYMSTKERDFNFHLDTYKTRQRSAITKYEHCFVPPRQKLRPNVLRNKAVFTGISVPNRLFLCILCRELCEEDEMLDHISIDHSTPIVEERAKPRCTCGEEFLNSVLLKSHLFKNKKRGNHQEAKDDETETLQSSPEEEQIETRYVIEVAEEDSDDEPRESTPNFQVSDDDADEERDERYLVIVTEPADSPGETEQPSTESIEEFERSTPPHDSIESENQ